MDGMTLLENDLDETLDLDDEDEMDSAALSDFAYALDADHFIRFERRGPRLLVSFEAAADDSLPLAQRRSRLDALAREQDWSVLSLVSQGMTWFRSPEVVTFFDALVDGTLLDQFDDLLFYGAGSGGHAALSYALTAPGARVLALSPQVALGPEAAEWDDRFKAARKVECNNRYLPVPANLAAARAVYLAYDAGLDEDRRHAALVTGPGVVPLPCRNLGADLEEALIDFGVLDDVVADAMCGRLDRQRFYTMIRARRDNPTYLRRIVSRLIETERPLLEALVVRNVAERTGRNRYARRFDKLAERLRARGIAVPPSRNPQS